MDYNILWTIIKDEPYATMSPVTCAAALNALSVDALQALPSTELLAWIAGGARFARLQKATESGPDEMRSIAMAALELVRRDGTSLDLNRADRRALIDALVAGGVLTADEKAALYAMATYQVSPAQEAGLPTIDVAHVASCREMN